MTRASGPVLEGRGLGKSFGGLRALAGVDASVAEGEALGLIGPNGAGKTTLFNVLAGYEAADAGRVLIRGEDATRLGPERRAALGLVRTFQHGRSFANLTVEENLLMGAHTLRRAVASFPGFGALASLYELVQALLPLGGFRREEEELRRRAAAIAARFGERLAPRMGEPAYSLSYANRRRLEIARALAAEPSILLLDEPTAGMNPSETAEMLEFLKGIKAQGITMVIIEHKLPLVMSISDRVIAMDEGEVIAEGSPAEVARDARVIEAYLGATRSVAGGSIPRGEAGLSEEEGGI